MREAEEISVFLDFRVTFFEYNLSELLFLKGIFQALKAKKPLIHPYK
jgi:hypothetical protein